MTLSPESPFGMPSAVIDALTLVRADGKVIDGSLSTMEIVRSGWGPSKVVALQWIVHDQPIALAFKYGALCKLLPDRKILAVIEDLHPTHDETRLIFIDPNGETKLVVDQTQTIRSQPERGVFCWFEAARTDADHCVGVIFRVDRDNSEYHLDIDTRDGTIKAVFGLH
jgi:hypothetical protein